MTNIPVIILKDLTKSYYLEKPRTLKKWFNGLFAPFERFTVISNFSLIVNKGDFILIKGPNGSGKSTLLKLISGITAPDSGKITTYGRIVPLIELGAGFNHELTGKENIIINATILGMEKSRINKITQQIINFSGVEKFIDVPLKRYSTGMISRLAFSIAIYSNPDILLLDEIFSIGDKQFQKKSFNALKKFIHKKKTIIICSHYDLSFMNPPPNRIITLK